MLLGLMGPMVLLEEMVIKGGWDYRDLLDYLAFLESLETQDLLVHHQRFNLLSTRSRCHKVKTKVLIHSPI